MTPDRDEHTEPAKPTTQTEPGAEQEPSDPAAAYSYQEGKRAGAHPAVVVLGVIAALWLAMAVFMPASKTRQAGMGKEFQPEPAAEEQDAAPVVFKVGAVLPEINAVSLVVPKQATESQVVALLKRLQRARQDAALSTLVPPTSPGNKLGDHAIAQIYIVDDAKYGGPEAIQVLARGAHAPGELYPQAIPFEVAMEQIRGFYRVDLREEEKPETASLGFADPSGVHSRAYRKLF